VLSLEHRRKIGEARRQFLRSHPEALEKLLESLRKTRNDWSREEDLNPEEDP
jgi:hypothetical protein